MCRSAAKSLFIPDLMLGSRWDGGSWLSLVTSQFVAGIKATYTR